MIRLVPPDAAGIEAAVEALAAGRLLLHPTETVVSLSGDPRREGPVAAARAIKGYDAPRPFLCLVADAAAARALAAEWPAAAAALAEALWPGPLTLVVAAADDAPGPVVDAGRVALRPASDPVSAALLAAWGGPLFSTSANRRDRPPSLEVEAAARALEEGPGADTIALGVLAPAPTEGAPAPTRVPSTIVDVSVDPPELLREGAVPAARIGSIVDLGERRG